MKKILISLSVFFIGFSFAANDTSSSISGSVNVPWNIYWTRNRWRRVICSKRKADKENW